MGQIVSLRCENCGNKIDLQIGQGIRDNNLDIVLGYFDVTSQNLIKDSLSSAGKDAIWAYSRMIVSCDVNHNIQAVPTFHIIENREDRIVAINCNCGGTHTFISVDDIINGTGCKCPKCGKTFKYSISELWD